MKCLSWNKEQVTTSGCSFEDSKILKWYGESRGMSCHQDGASGAARC